MANLKDIRNRIKSVISIQQVTNAMKMVAAAKLRKSQERMEQARPYAQHLKQVIVGLLPDVERSTLPLLEIREVKRTALVVVSSDRGLAGSFNTNAIKKAQADIDRIGREKVDLFCIGKKSRDYFKHRGYSLIEEHTDFWDDLNFEHAMKFGNGIISHFLSGKVDTVQVVYNEFKNVAVQILRDETLLPLAFEEGTQTVRNRIYEPSKEEIVKSLVPRHLNVQIWKYLLESYASEQAARMVAMENATENAGEMITDLTLEFNKARQSAITTEMLEIVSGAEALTE